MSFEELIVAVRGGEVEKVRAVLLKSTVEKKSLLNQFTDTGMTPLMLAASCGYQEVMKLIIKERANWNLIPEGPKSVITVMEVAEAKLSQTVHLLLELGAEVDLKNRDHLSALMIACKQGSTEIARSLLSHGANPNDMEYSYSPLYYAVEEGHVKVAKLLLDNSAKIVHNETSALERACYGHNFEFYNRGNVVMVETLLSCCTKDDVNFFRKNYYSPLMRASSGGANEIIRLLLAHGANIDAANEKHEFALLLAIKNGHLSTVDLLLKSGANSNLTSERGFTPLMEAILLKAMRPEDIIPHAKLPHKDVIHIVKLLLKRRADVNFEYKNKSTALILAIEQMSYPIVELLVDAGANVNLLAGSPVGGPLKNAVQHQQKDMVELFLKKGADVNAQDSRGITPLMAAGKVGIANLLLEHGAKLNVQDNEGKSALLHIVDKDYFVPYEVSGVLIEKGADCYLPDNDGRNAASILVERYKKLGLPEEFDVLKINTALLKQKAHPWGSLMHTESSSYIVKRGYTTTAEECEPDTKRPRYEDEATAQALAKKIEHIAKDYPGIEILGDLCEKTVTSSGATIQTKDSELVITIPEGAILHDETKLLVGKVTGHFKFPPGCQPVSSAYLIEPNKKVHLRRKVTIKMRHTANAEDCNKLVFMSAKPPPVYEGFHPVYAFKKITTPGIFRPDSPYGEITLDHYCIISIYISVSWSGAPAMPGLQPAENLPRHSSPQYMGKDYPSSNDLKFIKTKTGERRTYRLSSKIADDYRTIAATLGLSHDTLINIDRTTDFPYRIDMVFLEWIQNACQLPNGYPLSWDGLKEILEDSDLAEVAREFFDVAKDC